MVMKVSAMYLHLMIGLLFRAMKLTTEPYSHYLIVDYLYGEKEDNRIESLGCRDGGNNFADGIKRNTKNQKSAALDSDDEYNSDFSSSSPPNDATTSTTTTNRFPKSYNPDYSAKDVVKINNITVQHSPYNEGEWNLDELIAFENAYKTHSKSAQKNKDDSRSYDQVRAFKKALKRLKILVEDEWGKFQIVKEMRCKYNPRWGGSGEDVVEKETEKDVVVSEKKKTKRERGNSDGEDYFEETVQEKKAKKEKKEK